MVRLGLDISLFLGHFIPGASTTYSRQATSLRCFNLSTICCFVFASTVHYCSQFLTVACCLARPTPARPGQRPFERPWIRCPHCCTLTRTFSLKITVLNEWTVLAQVHQGQVSLSTFATSIKVPEILIRDASLSAESCRSICAPRTRLTRSWPTLPATGSRTSPRALTLT